jgi:hypothetical protein
MDESLFGIASDVRPTKEALFAQTSKNYYIDPQSGEKTRLKPNQPRSSGMTKGERKKERSTAFWERL